MEPDRLEGSVTGTIYRNEENNFSVIMVKSGRSEMTATGTLPPLAIGEQVILEGQFTNHPQYGPQLKVSSFEIVQPTTLLGIERFLASGLISGIKESSAHQIVEHFGEETLQMLSEHPERLMEIKGFGKKRWKQIAESYHQTMYLRTAMVFLTSYGIASSLATRIARRYGEATEQVIRENPYQLCADIEGVGFQTADRIAQTMGIARDHPARIEAGILFILREQALQSGHCYLPLDELVHRAIAILRVPEELIATALSTLTLRKDVICEDAKEGKRIYLPLFFQAEEEVATRLLDLYSAIAPGDRAKGETRIAAFEQRHGITFSEKQKEAILCALEFGVFIITGGPGTGKTTIIRCIISLLLHEGSVMLCAPTGRAAKRMSGATGRDAKTIHRLLEYTGEDGFAHDEDKPLESDCIIVDETSMVDILLMRSLLRAISPGTRLILVGDADQLPSVGPGNVLGDILASTALPAVRLTDIYRQSEESRIVVNAHRINHGEMPLLNEKGTDFFFNRSESATGTASTIVGLVETRLPGFIGCEKDERAQQIQVLAPMKKGDAGVIALNAKLQEALNPPSPSKPSLTWGETVFRLGDKVMQTRNDYSLAWYKVTPGGDSEGDGVFNGDLGIITDLDTEEGTLSVTFEDERIAEYSQSMCNLDNLDLAYAMSIHKSQGSEFPVVVIPVCGGPKMLLTRNLFYTALTRAKRMVVLVGRESVIADMVSNNHIAKRYTALADCLRLVRGIEG